LGVKRTCLFAVRMSAFDPKRTSKLSGVFRYCEALIKKIADKAAQPDETAIVCRSGIVHGQYVERLDLDRTVTDQ